MIGFYTDGMKAVDRLRGYPFVTKDILDTTPALYATENIDTGRKKVAAKWFSPSLTWYMVECNPETGEAFGYVENLTDPYCSEWGYFDLVEMGELLVRGIVIERDLYYSGGLPEGAI